MKPEPLHTPYKQYSASSLLQKPTARQTGIDDALMGLDEPSRHFSTVKAFREWFAGWKEGKFITARPKEPAAAPPSPKRRKRRTQPWELRRAEYLRNKRL